MELNKKSTDYRIGFICVIVSTTMYALMPSISKLGYEEGLNSYSILFGRCLVGLVIYLALILIKKESMRVSSKQFCYIMLISLFGTLNGVCAFVSYNYLPSGLASLMAMMYIIFIIIIEIVLRISKPAKYKLVILATSFAGILLILWNPSEDANVSAFGIFLGLAGALLYSVQVLLFNGRIVKEIPLEVIFFYETSPTLLIMPLIAVCLGLPPIPVGLTQWGYSAALAFFNSLIAMLAFYTAVRLIGAGNAALIGTAEPFISCIAGAVLMGDVLSARSIIGGLIIMASIFVLNYIDRKKASSA